ncbi:hypothetical protein LWI28_023830 [Acer negundo]|uniref:Uncharacterized protein n=1 Tax=Acer negundo TaxID=4023 RepID=A0AAD5J193_ACENE|nr:hypothetical protein LWI28_023830 [Acer negundo]
MGYLKDEQGDNRCADAADQLALDYLEGWDLKQTKASATSIGIRAVFVRDDIIMPPRRRPDQIPVDLAIERDRVIQLERHVEQLTA